VVAVYPLCVLACNLIDLSAEIFEESGANRELGAQNAHIHHFFGLRPQYLLGDLTESADLLPTGLNHLQELSVEQVEDDYYNDVSNNAS
jgi:hypothetical protein